MWKTQARWQLIRLAVKAILCVLALSCGGCGGTAVMTAAGLTAGVGLAQGQAESFINGELKAARMVSLRDAEHSTLYALEELQLQLKASRFGKHSSYFMAKADRGPEIKVRLQYRTPVVTKIAVRVGIMGDQAMSRLVLSRIDAHLGIHQPILPVEISPIVAPNVRPPSAENGESGAPDPVAGPQ